MAEHQHAGFELPAGYVDPEARPVDHELLGRLVGAAFDGCGPCQDALLDRMAQDPVTTARLVELACVATQGALGGLPASLTHDDVPGLAGPEFRRLARAGLDGANAELFRACEQLTAAERRAAADSAADLLVGLLATGGPTP
jgi:hypothetical protein